MKRTLLFLLPALLLLPTSASALDGPALTNGVRAVGSILAAEGCQGEFMQDLVVRNGWTPDDCTDILLALEASLRPRRTDYYSSFMHEVTFSLMADFATTNALPTLAELLWDETMPDHFGPRTAYVRISRCAPEFWPPLIRRLDATVGTNDLFAYYCYEDVRNYVDFLVRRAGEDVRNAGLVDDILREWVPAWQDSPQRLENAERMLRLHPEAASRSVFAGVTNRLRGLSAASRASPPRLVPAPVRVPDPNPVRPVP